MYWYNPNTRTSERVDVPLDDEEAIRMLAGHPSSATFVSEYAKLRHSGMPIETALIMVGHEERLRRHDYMPVGLAERERPSGGRDRVPPGTCSLWRCAFEKKARARTYWNPYSPTSKDPPSTHSGRVSGWHTPSLPGQA
jgi:hypothetical protein